MATLLDVSHLIQNSLIHKSNLETLRDSVNGIPLIQIKDITERGEIQITESTIRIKPFDKMNLSQIGDICIISSGPKSGYVFLNENNFPIVFSNQFVLVRSEDKNLYALLKSKESKIKFLAKGSAILHISRKDLGNLEL